MLNPKDCTHPTEHVVMINGDLKKCEFCGQPFVYKNGLWEKKK